MGTMEAVSKSASTQMAVLNVVAGKVLFSL